MTDPASTGAPEPGADSLNGGGPAPRERVGVIGAGYVGLVTGVCLASMGYQVTLRDIDANKVAALNDGQVPIYEPGLVEMMAEHRDRLTYTLSLERMLERSEVVFIAVDTPPTYSGDADLSRVMSVVEELEKVGADARHVLVMKSTVPVGTGERVRAELDARGLDQVGYCSNPEFLKEGAAIADFLHPDRVVIGSFDDAQGDRVAALYAPLGAPIVRTVGAVGRDGQVRLQRLPRHQDQLHQRDRERLRGGRRRRRGGRPRHGPRLAHRVVTSCAPASASAAAASPRTSPPSSSSPATRGTTSSCSPR